MVAGLSAQPSSTGVEDAVWRALGTLKDPCMVAAGLNLSLVDLGLVNAVRVEDGVAEVEITLTDVGCQFTHHVLSDIHTALEAEPGVSEVRVTLNWRDAWSEQRLKAPAAAAFAAAKARLSSSRAQPGSAAPQAPA